MSRARKLAPDLEVKPYEAPSGGWGSVQSLAKSLGRDRVHEQVRNGRRFADALAETKSHWLPLSLRVKPGVSTK